MLTSIPSPSNNTLELGPLAVNYYGLMIALGVLAAVWLARRRLEAAGGDPDFVTDLALWCVPAGLIGTRIYHVVTDYNRLYCGPPDCSGSLWPDAFKIWRGGLGIPGGIAAGFLVGVWYVRRRGVRLPLLMDAAAPAIPLAQAIGRWGNWFNQELFGRPTNLPWKLEIDSVHRPAGLENQAYYHPTFLYESLWNLGAAGLLILMGRKLKLREGKLFPAYVALYFLGRMWVEELRIDQAARVGDLRWNFVLSIIMVAVGLIWFAWGGIVASDEEIAEREERTRVGKAEVAAARAAADAGTGKGVAPAEQRSGEVEEAVAEDGPEVDGPGPEGSGADRDGGEATVGVDPEEGAGGTEVAERPE